MVEWKKEKGGGGGDAKKPLIGAIECHWVVTGFSKNYFSGMGRGVRV